MLPLKLPIELRIIGPDEKKAERGGRSHNCYELRRAILAAKRLLKQYHLPAIDLKILEAHQNLAYSD